MTCLPTLVSATGVTKKSFMLVKSASGAKKATLFAETWKRNEKSKYECDGDVSFMNFRKRSQ